MELTPSLYHLVNVHHNVRNWKILLKHCFLQPIHLVLILQGSLGLSLDHPGGICLRQKLSIVRALSQLSRFRSLLIQALLNVNLTYLEVRRFT